MAGTSHAFLNLLLEFRTYPAFYQWAGWALLILPLLLQAILCLARWVMSRPVSDGMRGSRAPLTIYVIVVLALLLAAAYASRRRADVLLYATLLIYFSIGCAVWVAAGFVYGCLEGDALDAESEELGAESAQDSDPRLPVTPLRADTKSLVRCPPRALFDSELDPPRKKLTPRAGVAIPDANLITRRRKQWESLLHSHHPHHLL